MNKLFFLIPLLSVAFIPLAMAQQAPSQPVITIGQNYDLIEDYQLGVATWSSHTERIFDGSDWKEFIVYDRSNIVQVESNSIGSLVYDKNSCSYSIYENGYVTSGTQIIPAVSWMPRIAQVGTDNYSEMTDLFNQQCDVQVRQGEDWVKITSIKTLTEDLDPVVIVHANGTQSVYPSGTRDIATVTQTLDIKTTNGIKETVSVYNGNPNWNNHKFALSQTVHTGDSITLAGNTYDIAAASGTVLDRQWIEDNEAQIFEIADSLNYDFDVGIQQLNAIQILNDGTNKVSMDFSVNDSTPYLSSYTVDPTFTQSSGDHWRVDTANSTGSSCDATSNYSAVTSQSLRYPDTGVSDACTRAVLEFDITNLPSNIIVTDTSISMSISQSGNPLSRNCDVMPMATDDISTMSTQQIADDIVTGTSYITNNSFCQGSGTQTVSLGSTANSDVQSGTSFSVGLKGTSEVRGGSYEQISSISSPSLTVTYTLPTQPSAPTNLSAVSGQPIDLSWTASSDLGGAATGDMTYKVERADYEFAQQPLPINAGSDSGVNMSTNVLLYHLDATKIDTTTTTYLDEDFDPSPSGWGTTDSSNLQITNNEIQVDYHSSTDDSIAYDLGSALGDSWTLKWKNDVTTYSGNSNYMQYAVGLTSADHTASSITSNQDSLLLVNTVGGSLDRYRIYELDNTKVSGGTGSVTTYSHTSTQETFWAEMTRNGSSLTLKLYSDEYSTLIEEQTHTISGTIEGLQYFKASIYDEGSSMSYGVDIDDILIQSTSTSDPYIEDTSGANNDSEDPRPSKTLTYTNDYSGALDGSWQNADEVISINNGRAELVASGTAASTWAQSYFDLGTPLSDNFVVRWTEGRSVQSSSAYNSHHFVGLTDTLPSGGGGSGGQLSSQNGDWLGYRWYYGTQSSTYYGVEPRMGTTNWGEHDNTANTRLMTCAIGNNSGNGVPKVDDVYYHEMKMVGGSEYTYTLYGDEGYTTVCSSATISSSGITATNPNNPGSWHTGDPSDLQYFVMATNRDSAKGVWTHWFDDLKVCDGQTDWANCEGYDAVSFSTGTIAQQIDEPLLTVKSTTLYDGTDSHTVGGWTKVSLVEGTHGQQTYGDWGNIYETGQSMAGMKLETANAKGVGELLDSFTITLKVNGGSPTGTIYGYVINSSGTTVATATNTLDASTVTGSAVDYTFNFDGTYTLQEDDRIIAFYDNGNGSTTIGFGHTTSEAWDGSDTVRTYEHTNCSGWCDDSNTDTAITITTSGTGTGTMLSFENTSGETISYEVEADKLRVVKSGNVYSDDFSTDKGWSHQGNQNANGGSSYAETTITNNSFKLSSSTDGSGSQQAGAVAVFDLGTPLTDGAWIARFTINEGTSLTTQGNEAWWFIISNDNTFTTSQGINLQGDDAIGFRHHLGNEYIRTYEWDGGSSTSANKELINWSSNQDLWFELTYDGTDMEVQRYTDGTYASVVGGSTFTHSAGDQTGLQYINIGNPFDTSMGIWEVFYDDIQICDGQTDWSNCSSDVNIIEATGQTISSSTPSHIQFNRGTSNGWEIFLDGTSVATNTDSTSLGTANNLATGTSITDSPAYTQTGTTVSASGTQIESTNSQTNQNPVNRVYKDIGSVSDSAFYFEFDYKQKQNDMSMYPIALQESTGKTNIASEDMIYLKTNGLDLTIAKKNGGSNTVSSDGWITIVANTQYYGVLIRDGNTASLKIYDDSARTSQVGTTKTVDVSDVSSLQYLHSESRGDGGGGTNMGWVLDNLVMYNDATGKTTTPSYYIGQSPTGTNTLPSLDEFYIFTSDKSGEASDIYQRGSNVFAQVGSTTGSTVTHSDNNSLVSGNTYFHRIVANNGAFDSDPSNVTSATAGVPPDAPTNLQATINNPNTAPLEVTLTWTDGAGQGTGTFQNYIVIRSPDSTFTSVSTVGTPTATTFTDTVPSGGGTFYYKVSDQATHGGSPNSSAANVTTPTVPDAPTISLAINNPDPSPLTITTTFTPPGNVGGSAITGYHLFHSGDNVTFTQVATGVSSPHDHTVSGVGTHYFKAQAVNLVGASVDSATQSIATPTAPSSPASLTVTLPDVDTAPFTVTLDWTAPTSDGGSAVTGYKVYRDSTLIDTLGNVLTLNNTAPSNASTVFNFEVTSLNNAGESTAVAQSWTSPAVPSQVQGVSGSMINSNVVLTWATPQSDSAITDYQVIRDGSPLALVGSDATTYTDSNNVQPDQSIVYTVKGISLVGTGSASAGTTVSTGSAAVLDLTANNVIGNSLVLTWTEPTYSAGTVTGYQINYTAPGFGDPNTIYIANTGTPTTVLPLSGLNYNANYTWSVGVITPSGTNSTGNWLNVTTSSDSSIVSANVTSGVDLDATNTMELEQIKFVRTDNADGTTTLEVIHPVNYDLNCNMQSKFAMTNQNYTNLPTTIIDGNDKKASFVFTGLENEVIAVVCTDTVYSPYDSAQYVLTQNSFPLIQQIANFTNGSYGTMGQFGAIDLVSLAGIIIAMIGFNRVNHVVGGFFAIVMFGVLGWFEIIQYPTAIVGGLATGLMLFIATQRKK